MSYTLQQLSYSVPFTGAEYVDTSKLTPLFPQPTPAPESDALGQWEFGPDSSSLIDLVNGRTLTPLSAGNPRHMAQTTSSLLPEVCTVL